MLSNPASLHLSTLPTAMRFSALSLLTGLALCANSVVFTLGPEKVPLELIPLRPGTFVMGSPDTEPERRANEPRRTVTLTKPFALGKTEITRAQWRAVTGKDRTAKQAGQDSHPVDHVSWDDAMDFCRQLTLQLRQSGAIPGNATVTLPTEAQWEYACRAGTDTPFAFGNSLDASQANFDGNHPYRAAPAASKFLNAAAPVASYKPNAWGFHDMHGNVMEWCRDIYTDTPGTGTETDPAGPETGTRRVYRGGNFRDIGAFCRSAARAFNLPHFRYVYLGFRVALIQD